VALPLVLIQTICSQFEFVQTDLYTGEVLVDSNATAVLLTSQQCITKAQTYLFLYIFLHGLVFWVVAYDLMPSDHKKKDDEEEEEEEDEEAVRQEEAGTPETIAEASLVDPAFAENPRAVVDDSSGESFVVVCFGCKGSPLRIPCSYPVVTFFDHSLKDPSTSTSVSLLLQKSTL
jgi:hypothetical protein